MRRTRRSASRNLTIAEPPARMSPTKRTLCLFGRLELPDDPNPCGGPLTRHHVRYRSEGGTNEPSNLVTLCRQHHDWVHSRDFTGLHWGDESFAYLRTARGRSAQEQAS